MNVNFQSNLVVHMSHIDNHCAYSVHMYTVYSSCCGKRQQSSTVTCAQNIGRNRVHQGRFSHAFTAEKGEAQKERFAVSLCRIQIVV